MLDFLNTLSLPQKLLGGLGLILIIVSIVFGVVKYSEHNRDSENANLVNQGMLIENSREVGDTINAIETANNAVDSPTSNELNVVCSKYDRNCPNGS